MPSHKKGYHAKRRNAKKEQKLRQQEEEEEDDLELNMDDGHEFYDDEFVAPEGEDLDEIDDENLDNFDEDELLNQGDEELDGAEYDEEGFGEGDEMEEEFGEEDEDEEEERGDRRQFQKIIIDSARLKTVIKSVNQNSKQAFKVFLKIFRGIILQGISGDQEKKKKGGIIYEVESGKVYNTIITYALTKVPHILKKTIENGGLRPGTNGLTKTALILCNSYFANLFKLVQRTSDTNILAYILTNTVLLVKILTYVPVYLRKFIHILIGLWGQNESNVVKFKAFLNLRAICQDLSEDKLESIFRKMYLTFIKDVRQVNWYKYDQITFMINCYVELLSVNNNIAYIVGFSYIRSIALHLKNCMKERTKENIFKIYNWQFLNSIRLWLAAIGAYPGKENLGRLAHPLIEITLGILRFYPNVKYAPFRLHLIDYLNDFSRKSGMFIPLTAYLLEMLKEFSFKKKRDKTSQKSFDFTINIRVQKGVLKTQIFYEQLFKKIINEIVDVYSNLTNWISFSETLVTTRIFLKKILKDMKAAEPRLELKRLIQLLDENEQDLNKARDLMEFSKTPSQVSAYTREYDKKILKNLNINKLSNKIKKDTEEYIKKNVLSEQEQFYAGDKEDQEDEDGYDDGKDGFEDEEGDEMEEEYVE